MSIQIQRYCFRLHNQTTLWGVEVLFFKRRMEEGAGLKWSDEK